jgi:hypothetical protein
MKLFAILNKELPLGKTLNALAHLSLGLGHRISKGTPSIDVYFGDSSQVRQFRRLSQAMAVQYPQEVVATDFTDTMTVDTAIEQLKRTKETPESSLTYFAASVIAPDSYLADITEFLTGCLQVNGYKSSAEVDAIIIAAPLDVVLPEIAPDYKASMVLNKKMPLPQIINPLVAASLAVGRSADLTSLHLLQFIDADDNNHHSISYHPYPIVTASKPAKHLEMAKNADENNHVVANTQRGSDQAPIVTVVFGPKAQVDAVVTRKETSLYKAELDASAFTAASSLPKKTTEPSLATASARMFTTNVSVTGNDEKKQVDDNTIATPSTNTYSQ